MKKEELTTIGLSDEQADKVLAMNGKDIEKHKRAVEQAKEDLATVQGQLADRDKDIEELKKASGDAESVRKQLEDLQGKYAKETEDYKAQLAERDYSDAMKRAVSAKGIKFSSKAAEKAYYAELKEKHLALKDGELAGFDDWHKTQLEADPTAFDTGKPMPNFAPPVGNGGAPASEGKGAMYAKQFNAQYAHNTNTNTNTNIKE